MPISIESNGKSKNTQNCSEQTGLIHVKPQMKQQLHCSVADSDGYLLATLFSMLAMECISCSMLVLTIGGGPQEQSALSVEVFIINYFYTQHAKTINYRKRNTQETI